MVYVFGVGVSDLKKCGGNCKDKSYMIWRSYLKRCYDPKDVSYKYYGGVGIQVCDEWLYYPNFREWYNENFKEGMVICKDRNDWYEPKNCRFDSISNRTKEVLTYRRTGEHFKKGSKANMKGVEYYATTPSQRSSFKRGCQLKGWKFEDFEEIPTEITNNRAKGKGAKKFLYIKK